MRNSLHIASGGFLRGGDKPSLGITSNGLLRPQALSPEPVGGGGRPRYRRLPPDLPRNIPEAEIKVSLGSAYYEGNLSGSASGYTLALGSASVGSDLVGFAGTVRIIEASAVNGGGISGSAKLSAVKSSNIGILGMKDESLIALILEALD
jgi:hypothetical protein